MFDLARIGPGCRVLDVAAGAGEQSIAAARRVGASGHVLATDIAPALLERAAADARAAGLVEPGDARARRRGARRPAGRLLRRGDQPRRADLLSGPAARAGRHVPRAQAGRAGRGHRLFDAGAQRLLLDPGEAHPRARAAAAAAARPAGPVLARRRGRARSRLREGGPARHRGAPGAVAGQAAERSRMRALRARVLRRACTR